MGNHIKWNEETPFPEGTEEFVDDLAKAIRLRVEAAELESKAKKLKSDANKLAMIALPILGNKVMSNLGGLTLYEQTRKTVDSDGVQKYLIEKSVDPRMVKAAWRNNTTEKTTQSVRFLKPGK